jgi:thioredoxin 1
MMMSEKVASITDSTFASEVLESPLPVLVDFWAVWCAPCKQIAPMLEDMASDFEGKLKIFKLNVDENRETAEKYAIRGIPTLLLFKAGTIVASQVGALSKSALSVMIQRNL